MLFKAMLNGHETVYCVISNLLIQIYEVVIMLKFIDKHELQEFLSGHNHTRSEKLCAYFVLLQVLIS